LKGRNFFDIIFGDGYADEEGAMMDDLTRKFEVLGGKAQMREILSKVYEALRVKGYDPVNQIVGYILSEDPTYITNYNNARSLICRLDRDELLGELVMYYLQNNFN
jgi:uncharacterized protein (UPF0297 family)